MRSLRPWLQLVRLPAVFTAMADIFLGFLLTHRGIVELGTPGITAFVLLLTASSCLYLAGMVFNDVFDWKIDLEQRPDRPIPSGRVTLRSAVVFGGFLVLMGIGAAQAAGSPSLFVALLLALAIFAYDGYLKRTPLGPLAMGSCRFLNVLLGASAGTLPPRELWGSEIASVAIGLGIYIAGVTWFARQEAERSRPVQLLAAAAVINLGLGALIWQVGSGAWAERGPAGLVQAALAVILLTIDLRIVRALINPAPATVQTAVRTMLLSLIVIDATLILARSEVHPAYAMVTASLVLPAALLGRWIYVT